MGLGDIESNEKQTAHERCRCTIAYYLVLITKLEFEPLLYGRREKEIMHKTKQKSNF